MKRLLVLILLIPLFFIPTSTSASGIFGLSKCERVIREINEEEKIRYKLWVSFSDKRILLVDQINKNVTPNDSWLRFLNSIILPLESSNRIYLTIDKNKKCFSGELTIEARTAISNFVDWRAAQKSARKVMMSNDYNQIVNINIRFEGNIKNVWLTYKPVLDKKS